MSHVRSDECVPTLFHHYMRGASTFHLLGFLTWLTKFILPEILSRVVIITRSVSFYDFIISFLHNYDMDKDKECHQKFPAEIFSPQNMKKPSPSI